MSSDYGHLAQVRDRAMAEPHHPQRLVNVRLDCLDTVLKHYAAMAGEHAVLAGLLRECDAVLATIEADDGDEADRLSDLRMALAYAIDPHKRHEGALL
jgi:hypothetical protein